MVYRSVPQVTSGHRWESDQGPSSSLERPHAAPALRLGQSDMTPPRRSCWARRASALPLVLACVACGEPSGGAGKKTREPFVFTAAGDYGSGDAAGATLELVAASRARFHLALGDFAYDDEPESAWCEWVKARVGPTFPFLLVAGNHEDDFGDDGHIDGFSRCLPDRVGAEGRYGREYYFDVGGLARVILVSPDLTIDGEHYYYGDGNRHHVWLSAAIDGARAAGLPWVVVGMHKSCVSVGQYYCSIYSQLMDLLVEKRVDLVLHGHDHSYQRTKQLALGPGCPSLPLDGFNAACVSGDGRDGVYPWSAGTVSVIVGTAGRPLYALAGDDPEAGYFVTWMGGNSSPRNGLLRVRVTADALDAEFVGSTSTSEYADRFAIRRQAGE